jgi:hypothetical protein
LRLTAKRKPVGLIFCPISLDPSVANRHINVTCGFADAVAAALINVLIRLIIYLRQTFTNLVSKY